MPTNKTALEQACDEIKGMANPYPRNDLEREYEAGMRAALRMVREHLETERTQIEEAYYAGDIDGLRDCQDRAPLYKNKYDYFETTYKK